MTTNLNQQYDHYIKKAWIFYTLAAIIIAAVLVLFVAQDNEERFFYGLMTLAAAYVLRPGERLMDKQILKYTGVARPTKEE